MTARIKVLETGPLRWQPIPFRMVDELTGELLSAHLTPAQAAQIGSVDFRFVDPHDPKVIRRYRRKENA